MPECAALYVSVGRSAFSWRGPQSFCAEDFLAFAAEEDVFVAEAAGEIVGVLTLYQPESFVHALYVSHAAQGQGIGRALLALAASSTCGNLTLKCDLANRRALQFYDRLGLERMGGGESDGVAWVKLIARRPIDADGIAIRAASPAP